MTLRTMQKWLAALEAAGVSPDEDVLVDASSDAASASFRGRITGASMQHGHDDDDTPYGVLTVEDLSDEVDGD